MTDISKLKDEIRKSIKWSQKRPKQTGGQTCGTPQYPVILTCEALELEITYGRHSSSLKNKEQAYLLFELLLDEEIR